MEAHVGITSVEIVATSQGGFPVDNIAYWKEVHSLGGPGPKVMTVVHFKTGGFIDLEMTPDQFTSLVYGEPF